MTSFRDCHIVSLKWMSWESFHVSSLEAGHVPKHPAVGPEVHIKGLAGFSVGGWHRISKASRILLLKLFYSQASDPIIIVFRLLNNNNNNNCGIYIVLYSKAQIALHSYNTSCGTLPYCFFRHALHNFIRKNSMIQRCPQVRISDKPSHRGHRPLLFPNSVWVL